MKWKLGGARRNLQEWKIQELLDMMDYDDAAEWQQISDDLREKLLRKKQKRDEMKSGGLEA